VQIERAGAARADPADRLRVMRREALAELARQDAAAGAVSCRRSGGCAAARLNTSSSMRA
jgi:hypothetical protein